MPIPKKCGEPSEMIIMNLRYFAIYLLIILFSGCAGWRSFQEVETPPMPDQFQHSETVDRFVDEPWWQSFSDDNLNSLMEEVFESNLSLEQAFARFDRLHAGYKAANASWFPTFNLSATYQDNGFVGDPPPQVGTMSPDNYDVRLSTRYEVDFWGKLSANRSAAKEDLLAGQADLRAFLISLSAQSVRMYYSLLETSLQINLLEKTISSYDGYYQLIRGRYERGIVSSLEVYQAESTLAGTKSRKAQLEIRQANIQHGIDVLLGRYPRSKGQISLPEQMPVFKQELSPGIPSEVLKRRPDVLSVYHRMRAADKRNAEAVAGLFPSFSLTGGIGGSDNQLKDALDPEGMVWNALANLTAPIFQGGRLQANVDQSEAAFVEQIARYKETILNALREVEDALVRVNKQQRYVGDLEQQVYSAEQSLNAATDSYFRGLIDYAQVVLIQTTYFNAASNLISAKRGLIDSRIDLVTALGGDWTKEFINSISDKKTEEASSK